MTLLQHFSPKAFHTSLKNGQNTVYFLPRNNDMRFCLWTEDTPSLSLNHCNHSYALWTNEHWDFW